MGASLPVDRVIGPIAWTIYATPSIAYQPLAKALVRLRHRTGDLPRDDQRDLPDPAERRGGACAPPTPRSSVPPRVYGAGRMRLYRSVYLPSTVPFLFAGLRQAVVLAHDRHGRGRARRFVQRHGRAHHPRLEHLSDRPRRSSAIRTGMVVLWSVGMTQVVTAIETRGRAVDEEGQAMSVVSATGTVRIVRPRRVVALGLRASGTLLLIGVIAAVAGSCGRRPSSWFHWIPEAFLPAPTAVARRVRAAHGRPGVLERLRVQRHQPADRPRDRDRRRCGRSVSRSAGRPVLRFMVAPFLWCAVLHAQGRARPAVHSSGSASAASRRSRW